MGTQAAEGVLTSHHIARAPRAFLRNDIYITIMLYSVAGLIKIDHSLNMKMHAAAHKYLGI